MATYVSAQALGVFGSSSNLFRWVVSRLVVYLVVAVGSGALFLAGAAIYAYVWPAFPLLQESQEESHPFTGTIPFIPAAPSVRPSAPAPRAPEGIPVARLPDASEVTGSTAPLNVIVAAHGADQWVFSKFKGTDVYSSDDARIGDVSDIVFDKSGKIVAIIVGAGGFLGIGEKHVSISMSDFQIVPDTGAASHSSHFKLRVPWTKEQFKNAPYFQYGRNGVRER